MATINDFRAWYERDLSRYAPWDKTVDIIRDSLASTPNATNPPGAAPHAAREITLHVFTDNNCYSITVKEPRLDWQPLNPDVLRPNWQDGDQAVLRPTNGYLGCIASSRKPRAGEDWSRGSDLSDGPLTEATWRKIVADIVSYELVDVHINHKRDTDRPIPPPIGMSDLEGYGSQEPEPSDTHLGHLTHDTAAAIRRLAASIHGGDRWSDAKRVLAALNGQQVAVDA